MTARCEPPPEWRDRDGWHEWSDAGQPYYAFWHYSHQSWYTAWFLGGVQTENMAGSYTAPVTPHAEVEALRADLERERMRLAACGVVAMADTPDSAARARDMHPDYRSASCDDVARTVNALMALRARVAELEGALKSLIGAIDILISDSAGVAGLHMNGDLAPWDELTSDGQFNQWLGLDLDIARAALERKP